jgi:hypothetical protein
MEFDRAGGLVNNAAFLVNCEEHRDEAIHAPRSSPWIASLCCKDNIKTFTTRLSMNPLIITARGQVTLRKDLLKHLGVRPGEKIAVVKLPGGRIEMRAARPRGEISDAFGFLKKKDGPSLSIDDMNKIAARGWTGKR